jgi:release factor glutamine methyltransferase
MTDLGATVGQALLRARALGVERLDAQRVLADRLERPRSWLIAHDDAPLPEGLQPALEQAWARLAAGEPLAYLLGTQGFHGLNLAVGPDVLIPRSDTELLVDWALELLAGCLADALRPRVADLGTGSGAIALAVKHAHPAADVTAVDISASALATARGNAERLGIDVAFVLGSWFEALAGRRFELLLSNPPYIAPGDPHLAALQHEPQLALVAGDGGLAALRQVASGARAHLEAGGWLLLEHGHDQAEAVTMLLRDNGYLNVATRRDGAGRPRCTAGRR